MLPAASGPSCRAEPVDAIVVCAYGLLIPQSLLEQALWLNVHPSLLPRWRGAAPVERAILAGDEETGVTIHETVDGARRRARSRRRRRSRSAPEDDAGASSRARPRSRRGCSSGVLPDAAVHAAARRTA